MNMYSLIKNNNLILYYDEFGDYIFCIDIVKHEYFVYYVETISDLTLLWHTKISNGTNILVPIENSKYIIFGENTKIIVFDKINLLVHEVFPKEIDGFLCENLQIDSLKLHYDNSKKYTCYVYDEFVVSDDNSVTIIDNKIEKSRKFEIKNANNVKVFLNNIYLINNETICCIDKFSYLDEFDKTSEVY